jgi:hydroxymethylglutaryl-CoA synthase
MEKLSLEIKDFDHFVFHMPNGKFPTATAKCLGVPMDKLETSLVVKRMGNCYSGSSLVGLAAVLDIANPGERILVTSYGSGAGSDSFSFTVTDKILERRDSAPKTEDYIKNKKNIDYGTYVKLRGKLKM